MPVDPQAEWCNNCTRTGHSELNCPFVECDECDGEGVVIVQVAGPDYFGNYDSDEVRCHVCDGEGYRYLPIKEDS